jgi:hypothetical protein
MKAPFVTLLGTALNYTAKELTIKSPAFLNKEMIPKKYTSDGANINPPLILSHIPDETKSMVLIVEDPDAPVGIWVHWLVWNIHPSTKINEDAIPGVEGINAFRQHHYGGPCPPSGTHHYFFKLYALDTLLQLPQDSTKHQVERAMKDHVVGYGELIGLYSHDQKVTS